MHQSQHQRLSWSGTGRMGCQRYGGTFRVRKYLDVNSNRCTFIHRYQVIKNLGDIETIGKDISRAKIRINMLAFEILFEIHSSITSIESSMLQFQSNDFADVETAKSNEHHFAWYFMFQKKLKDVWTFSPKPSKYLLCEQQNNDQNAIPKKE
ncbi:hypothetical protein RFI_29525 [Reticulomyxa filosa]|uniref:Uncharacterized protein n=1 Tax=Reticulomyxa filosa TaxID=46433 RepID=X6M4D3_RETFI|nr:hypothetical protein RFI_29525 [Reticulomyxa filosa]|eukprot:ETO07865.1 hypothetical protein RFI_29525 [Reticulomyxa filosa]